MIKYLDNAGKWGEKKIKLIHLKITLITRKHH